MKGQFAMKHKSILAACKKRGYGVTQAADYRRAVEGWFCANNEISERFIRWRVEEDEVRSIYCSNTLVEATTEEARPGYQVRTLIAAVAHLENFRYSRQCHGFGLVIKCRCGVKGRALVYSARVEVVWGSLDWSIDFNQPERVAFLRGQPDNEILLDFLEENTPWFTELRAAYGA